MSTATLTRRDLLKALGGGLLVMAAGPDVTAMAWAQRGGGQNVPQEISAWIHIGQDGKITAFTGKAEVGQNARTSITQSVAEELRVPVSDVTVLMADTDKVPYDMGAFGSRTTPTMLPQVRRAAAGAREALVDIAAKKWNVNRASLSAKDGHVTGGSQSASYGELATGQSFDETIDANIALTPANDWKVMGQSIPKMDGRDFVTGKHQYSYDMSCPGMLHGVVLRPPKLGDKLTTADTTAAAAMPGVKVVQTADFVGVAAPTLRGARAALAKVKAEWSHTPQPSNKDLPYILRGGKPATSASSTGFAATYDCAYIAHVPLEPRCALAEWDGTKMTVHTGTQRPFAVRDEVVAATGLTPKQVRVIVPDTGSGYGGKHTGEAAVEAARMAVVLKAPVKVQWTRPEEFMFAYFRPAGIADITATADKDGKLTSWSQTTYNAGPPGIATPYDVPNPQTAAPDADSPLRKGSYRALAATFNNFARETAMDELAHRANLDPIDFRLKNLKDDRLKAVLEKASKELGSAKPEKGHGLGIACATEKGGYIATGVEVAVDEVAGTIRVIRAVTVFECGAIVNPDMLRNQVEGALIMGLGGALFEEIEFEDGKILNGTLGAYRVPRYSDIPKIQSFLIDRKDLPSAGAGEAPIICIAPAIANAVFNACSKRLRSMPLKLA